MTDLYTQSAYKTAEVVTRSYSTSFSSAVRLLSKDKRPHIYNIYGVVRVADEIVDTYTGKDAGARLDKYETEILAAISSGYSTDMIIHAFAHTVRTFGINRSYIKSFFASMRLDLSLPQPITNKLYKTYIYGSAEVVGLMCLTIFCSDDRQLFDKLKSGAKALGSAFQKVNFLRDVGDDAKRLGRNYFPSTHSPLTDREKRVIEREINVEFAHARDAILSLPPDARRAVYITYMYYGILLHKISRVDSATLYKQRIRVSNTYKFFIIIRSLFSLPFKKRPGQHGH